MDQVRNVAGGHLTIPQFDRSQNPADWINAIQVNAVLSGLDDDATLRYAKLMISPELRAGAAAVANLAELVTHLDGQVAGNATLRNAARRRLQTQKISPMQDLPKLKREINRLFGTGQVAGEPERVNYLISMLAENEY